MPIQIMTDSTADLSPELIKRFSIHVIPLTVGFGGDVYRDGLDISAADLIGKIQNGPYFPKTTQPSPAEFLAKFRELLAGGDEVVYIGLSSQISGTFTSARLALDELGDAPVSIVDSLNLSMGVGLLALHAAELVQTGKGRPEIVHAIETMVPKVKTAFIVDTLDFLYKGGRLSVVGAFVGNILNIHPMIQMADGRLQMAEKIRGRRERALERMLEWAVSDPERIDPRWISVTHVCCPRDAEYLAAEIRRLLPSAQEVVVTEAGAVIASHCGPGTIGILYVRR